MNNGAAIAALDGVTTTALDSKFITTALDGPTTTALDSENITTALDGPTPAALDGRLQINRFR